MVIKRKVNYLFALVGIFVLLFFLSSCGGAGGDSTKKPSDPLKGYKSGTEIELDNSNIRKYLKFKVETSKTTNKDGYTTKLKVALSSEGYKSASYWAEYITCTLEYKYLGDDGVYTTSTISLSINPDPTGKASAKSEIQCHYRSASDLSIKEVQARGKLIVK